MLSSEIALGVGLSHQRIDGILLELQRAGLAIQLLRTAQGYEWTRAIYDERGYSEIVRPSLGPLAEAYAIEDRFR